MNKLLKIILYICFINSISMYDLYSQESNKVYYKFTETDTSYSFLGYFSINADPDCLLEICFRHKHISNLAPDAIVTLIDTGDNWNKIHYTYKKFIYFKNKSLWLRKIDRSNYRVDFELISSKNNKDIMPNMLSSKGYYKLTFHEEVTRVEYYQKCTLSKSSITGIYLSRTKKEAIKFMDSFLEYSVNNCSKINHSKTQCYDF